MNAISTCTAPDGDDQVTRLHSLLAAIRWDHCDISAVDQRVSHVARIEINSPVDRGNSHAIAIVADACHNALGDRPGMKDSRRQVFVWSVRRSEAEHVRVAQRLRSQSRSQRIAD